MQGKSQNRRSTGILGLLVGCSVVAAAFVAMAACGGGIPDDVEWEVVGGMEAGKEPDDLGGGKYRVQLDKPISEDTMRAIGKKVRERHINICRFRDPQCQWYPQLSTVWVGFYLPGMDTTIEAWGITFFLPDEEQVKIIGNLQR